MSTVKNIYIVSSCLVGLCTRYDGNLKQNDACLNRLNEVVWIPVCPEQLGGLPTPREAADIIGGDGDDVLSGSAKVMTKNGNDVTSHFINGAKQVLAIVKLQKIERAFLKAGSPSCAVMNKPGVTAALLKQHGVCLEEF